MTRTRHKARRGDKRPPSSNESRDGKRQRQDNWKNTRGDESSGFSLPLRNKRFEAFYQALGFIHANEWDAFMSSLLRPLPACFHMDPTYAFSAALKSELFDILAKLPTGNADSKISTIVSPLQELKWYPNGCGFQLGADRRSIRKDETLTTLHKWMIQHTDNGNITRQEAVSMVPPLALNVEPHHRCLDMCAAPGSKTSQLLEIVNRSLNDSPDRQGLVVANDSDTTRAYMLVHQCRRIKSPLLLVTTHKGQNFPYLSNTSSQGERIGFFDRVLCDVPCSGDGTIRKNPEIWSKWSAKNSIGLHGLQLHIANRGILLLKPGGLMVYSTCSMSPYEDEAVVAELLRQNHGMIELVDAREYVPLFKCRPGLTSWPVVDDTLAVRKESDGKAYRRNQPTSSSTADVDAVAPIAADASADGNIEASSTSAAPVEVEVKEQLSGIEALQAMDVQIYSSFDSLTEQERSRNRRSVFPPTADELSWMHLERCMRCVPHDEDTGGFFVAAFRKISSSKSSSHKSSSHKSSSVKADDNAVVEAMEQKDEVNAVASSSSTITAFETLDTCLPLTSSSSTAPESAAKLHMRGISEFALVEESEYQMIRAFYGFTDVLTRQQLYMRNEVVKSIGKGKPSSELVAGKIVYLVSKGASDALAADRSRELKIVTAGMKVMERKVAADGQSVEYRLLQEGIHLLAPHITQRKIDVNIQDFCNLLGAGLVALSTMSPITASRILQQPSGVLILIYRFQLADVLSSIPSTAVAVQGGPFTARIMPTEHVFHMLCWKGSGYAINVVCKKIEIEATIHQLEALGVLLPKIGTHRADATTSSSGNSNPDIQEGGMNADDAAVMEEVDSDNQAEAEVEDDAESVSDAVDGDEDE